ncbi:GNAT family N-acetyltransferase [Streptomyces sp. SID8352]|uniref:GNAT family N-acetyltransferase n=1 Tax=Streptomyces sp. SID8352 TaxID=2690338 RepID=UPI001368FB86|nr:GNAT family N-acetyltransferase [Streptomyces sp. SID8352]MYU22673.1 GNAT family N-acetyltransferase [Streptomyces sp. SID8352]
MRPMTIRRALAHDAQHLTSLIQRSGAYRGQYAPIIAGYRVTAEYIARHQVFVAVGSSGRVLGFYSLVLDPPELDLAFVADEAQGLGVGRRLIGHMVGRAGEAGVTGVRVVAHPPAEDFYLRMGAQRVGTVAPSPPKVAWERPDLRFTIPAGRGAALR